MRGSDLASTASAGRATGWPSFVGSCETPPPGGKVVDKVDCDGEPKASHDGNIFDMENEDNSSKLKGASYTIVN